MLNHFAKGAKEGRVEGYGGGAGKGGRKKARAGRAFSLNDGFAEVLPELHPKSSDPAGPS